MSCSREGRNTHIRLEGCGGLRKWEMRTARTRIVDWELRKRVWRVAKRRSKDCGKREWGLKNSETRTEDWELGKRVWRVAEIRNKDCGKKEGGLRTQKHGLRTVNSGTLGCSTVDGVVKGQGLQYSGKSMTNSPTQYSGTLGMSTPEN